MSFVADVVTIGSMIMVTLFSLWMLKQLFSSSN